MATKWLFVAPVAGALGIGAGIGADQLLSAAQPEDAKQDVKPAVTLPITRVVLFNSGVGYFSRSGEVTDDARVDLTFPEQDINDLLKSMVLEDFNGGRIAAVSYDSREPITRTLVQLRHQPQQQPDLRGHRVSQMRGERVDVVLTPGAVNQPGKLSGVIVGVEKQKVAAGNGPATVDVEVLNMWCAEGLRSVKLPDVQQLKFANPVVESEFRRALDVLALSHDSQKKAVSLHFAGDGKRKVQVGYVIEAPIWKTSYRLVLGEKEKPYLQGWAMVENPTDEDWAGVKMALISGRPISFKMDLYNPLFINRPDGRAGTVRVAPAGDVSRRVRQAHSRELADLGMIGEKACRRLEGREGSAVVRQPGRGRLRRRGFAGRGGQGGAARGEGRQRTDCSAPWTRTTRPRSSPRETAARARPAPRHRHGRQRGHGRRARRLLPVHHRPPGLTGAAEERHAPHRRQGHRGAEGLASTTRTSRPSTRCSGLKFKNTSGAHLNQGPITVFEGSVYAGDTRVLDVQPNEERLVSYAIDLGTEVDAQVGPGTQKITSVKAVKGIVTTTTKVTEEKKYKVINRSQTDRTLLIEHANRTNQQFKLVDTEKPMEETPEVYRFQTPREGGRDQDLHGEGGDATSPRRFS